MPRILAASLIDTYPGIFERSFSLCMSIEYLLLIFYENMLSLWLCNLIKMCYTHCITLPSVHTGQGTLDKVAREDFHDIQPVHIQGEVFIQGLYQTAF